MTTNELYIKILEQAGKAVEAEMKRLLIQPHKRPSGRSYPMKKGALYNSIKVEVKNNVLQVLANDYAQYVDQGRKNGTKKVPIAALEQWIRRNNIKPRNAKGQFISIIQFAYMIQMSIYKRGMNPRNFIRPAFALGENIIEELIEINGQFIFENEVDDAFSNL